MDFKEKLTEVRKQIAFFAMKADLTDDEAEQLDALNKQAVKLENQITAQEQLSKAAETEKAKAKEETETAIADAVKKERGKWEAQARRLPFEQGAAPYQAQYSDTWKYDGLDAANLGLVINTLRAANKPVAPAAMKAMSLRVGELKDDNTSEGRKDLGYIRGSFKAATGIDPEMKAIEAAVKAGTDPMYTGGTTDGGDWVGAAYSTELWRIIRANCLVAARVPFQIIPDNYPNITIPLESTDPTWYKVAEATSSDATLKVPAATVAASQATTGKKEIVVGKMGARVLYTGEMVEDSLVAFVPSLRSQLELSGTEIMESMIIDGDTETTVNTNINNIDGGTGTPVATSYYLINDGFRKLALVTNTANSRSAGGSLTIEDYVSTLQLMGTAGLGGSDPSKVAFIVDGNVHYANMKLPEVKTRDVNSAATIENGFLKMAYNVPIIPSWHMHRTSAKRLTNSAGKVVTNDANNLYGSIIGVRFDQWKQAFKRRMTMETTRIANADSWEIVALARWGMSYRDTEAAAITYYVGV